jgi:hypothetical protein
VWALALALAAQMEETRFSGSVDGSEGIMVRSPASRPGWTKSSPRHGWKFDRLTEGWGKVDGRDALRFRVFSQGDCALSKEVARTLLRFWEFNRHVLGLDHSRHINRQTVDVYLCQDGPAGGEHAFVEDPETLNGYQAPSVVNTIHIYQVDPQLDRFELCRELAHEYGHATLPPVRVAGGREEWANGDAGERVYLSWLRRMLRKGALANEDASGAPLARLDRYWQTFVVPLADRVALRGPGLAGLSKEGDEAFEGFLSLVCWALEHLHDRALARSFALMADMSPAGYLRGLEEAASEIEVTEIMVPARLMGREVWYPVGSGRLVGATATGTQGAWKRFRPGKGVRVFRRPD